MTSEIFCCFFCYCCQLYSLLTDFPNSALVHDSVARRCWLRVMEIESVPGK